MLGALLCLGGKDTLSKPSTSAARRFSGRCPMVDIARACLGAAGEVRQLLLKIKADRKDHRCLEERLLGLGPALNALSHDDDRAAAMRLPLEHALKVVEDARTLVLDYTQAAWWKQALGALSGKYKTRFQVVNDRLASTLQNLQVGLAVENEAMAAEMKYSIASVVNELHEQRLRPCTEALPSHQTESRNASADCLCRCRVENDTWSWECAASNVSRTLMVPAMPIILLSLPVFVALSYCCDPEASQAEASQPQASLNEADPFVPGDDLSLVDLLEAAVIGDLATVQGIIASKKVDLDAADEVDLYTAVLTAAEAGHLDVVQALKEAGANIDCRECDRRTPLYAAAVMGHHDVVQYLVDAGANVDARDNENRSIFWVACAVRRIDIASILLANGCDLNARADSAETALDFAVKHNHAEVVEWLLAELR